MAKDTRELTSLEDIFNDIFLNGFSDLHFELVQEHINQAKAEAVRKAKIEEANWWKSELVDYHEWAEPMANDRLATLNKERSE